MILIGAALYFDLDGQYDFAEAPEFVSAARMTNPQEEGVSPGKGDRLLRPVDIVSDKQTYTVPTTIKVGDKEIVKARAFTRLQTTLTLTPTGFSDAVPPFNPLRLTDGGEKGHDTPVNSGPVQNEAEVTFRTEDLSPADAERASDELSDAEAQAQVVDTMKAPPYAEKSPAQPLPPQFLLMRTRHAGVAATHSLAYATVGSVSSNAPFASIEVRMIPENVTNVAKSTTPDDASPSEKLVHMHHGMSFEDVLKSNGASAQDATAISAAFGVKPGNSPVGEGQKIILLPEEPAVRGAAKLARVSVYADDQLKATVAINDNGLYAPVSLRPSDASRKATASNEEDARGGISLYQSLYETSLKQGVPRQVIDVLIRVFANDVDFQRSTAPGDSIEAFFSDPDEIDPRSELLFAAMTVRDQTFKYYRFQTPDDNMVDYYDENGRSTRKFLLRKPIVEGEMTSPFGMRYHPILHFYRMHTGVDWAADWHADLRGRQRGHHQSRLGRRLWTQGRNSARERLRDDLQSHVRLCPRHCRGRSRHAGPGHRLSRQLRTGDRAAPALRSDHQRQLRRPYGDQTPPDARIRRQNARGLPARTGPHRATDGSSAWRRGDGEREANDPNAWIERKSTEPASGGSGISARSSQRGDGQRARRGHYYASLRASARCRMRAAALTAISVGV